jgi:hypothetical protein
MPSFEIPDGPTTVALKKEGAFHKGSAVFGVTNKTGEGLTARFSVQVQGDGKAEWYQVQGEPERSVAAGENQTVTVVAKIPAATPPGQHRIKLRAINVNDPDNDSTDSSAATVTVPAAGPAPPPKKPFPWWILAVVGGVLVLVIGVDHRHRGDEQRLQGPQRGRPTLCRGGQGRSTRPATRRSSEQTRRPARSRRKPCSTRPRPPKPRPRRPKRSC